ncbi:hypothetical protein BDR05DRAFT_423555 [Suillus weaverae]|nr:hypothetical protein BDR05DRAFT_423555 [Suillus weaverae]
MFFALNLILRRRSLHVSHLWTCQLISQSESQLCCWKGRQHTHHLLNQNQVCVMPPFLPVLLEELHSKNYPTSHGVPPDMRPRRPNEKFELVCWSKRFYTCSPSASFNGQVLPGASELSQASSDIPPILWAPPISCITAAQPVHF